jgi:CheY-like chemotaxis protein
MAAERTGDTGMPSARADSRHRVLLVEDDVEVREAIECLLGAEGVDVACASEGREALYVLRAEPRPCLIVLDLNMPGVDGWEFRRRQLLWPQMATIPVVVLSGHSHLKAVTRTMQAVAVWQKPMQVDLLLRAVADHCPGH